MARLTDKEIDVIALGMPGGVDGFMKGWGWQQFAKAIEDATIENLKKQGASAWLSTDCIGERFLCYSKPLDNDRVQELYALDEHASCIAEGKESIGVVDEGDDGLFANFETPNGVMVKRGDKLYTIPQAESATVKLLRKMRAAHGCGDVSNWHEEIDAVLAEVDQKKAEKKEESK